MLRNTSTEYGSVTKFMHWLIFLLVAGLLIAGFFMGDIEDKALKGQVIMLHKSIGITVLALMVFRLMWAFSNTHPGYTAKTPAWQRIAARSLHGIFYVVLIIMPLSGWIMSTAANRLPDLFGLGKVALPFVPLDKATAKFFSGMHTYLAWTILVLLGIHILAALKHHYIDKDNVLRRMLPGRK